MNDLRTLIDSGVQPSLIAPTPVPEARSQEGPGLVGSEPSLQPAAPQALGAERFQIHGTGVATPVRAPEAELVEVRKQLQEKELQLAAEKVRSAMQTPADFKEIFEKQQHDMEWQLEELRSEVEDYRTRQESSDEDTPAGLRDTIGEQYKQLELLATRVKQLVSTNKDLNDSNRKMYEKLEEAVKKMIPLRRQIEELEKLQDTLQRFIREKYDRTFTIKKLQPGG